jgi:predicted heme/steroid binding protein/uncharacterized membrane protein
MRRVALKTFLLIGLLILFRPGNALCTVEYAEQTGRACISCHVDPAGGGALTPAGKAFQDSLRLQGRYRPLHRVQRVVRLFVGYLHMMTAILWFGTILYVHIILKPAYAAQGLPRGELMLGWASIIIMAVTGTLLSIARVPSWHMLFHTRFGILLSIKILLFLIMVSTALFVTFIVGPRLRKKREQALVERKGDMTADELSRYDGKEGRSAYVAYKGTLYDVTNSKLWREGSHLKRHSAGSDLTDVLKTAPHSEDRVLKMPVVGNLVPAKASGKPAHIRLFYFFAYMNLVIVFLIVFIISLWRWW